MLPNLLKLTLTTDHLLSAKANRAARMRQHQRQQQQHQRRQQHRQQRRKTWAVERLLKGKADEAGVRSAATRTIALAQLQRVASNVSRATVVSHSVRIFRDSDARNADAVKLAFHDHLAATG